MPTSLFVALVIYIIMIEPYGTAFSNISVGTCVEPDSNAKADLAIGMMVILKRLSVSVMLTHPHHTPHHAFPFSS